MNDILTIICSGILASLIWWFFSSEYKKYRIDLTRQRLFKIRDELFDHANNNEIPFDSKAYGIARSTINGMIRFTHNLSFIRLVTILISHKVLGRSEIVDEYNKRMEKELSKLPKESAQFAIDAILTANVVLVTHVVFTSLLLTLVAYPFIFIFKFMNIWSSTIQKVSKPISNFTWAAIDVEANYTDLEARDRPLPV